MSRVRVGRLRWNGERSARHERYVRLLAEGSGLERMIAFSDAVFAIAMTILVLELRVPDVEPSALPEALAQLVTPFLSFVLSFVVVAMVWLSHHRKFRAIVAYDQTLLRLNLLVLMLVASLGVPTGVLGRYGDQVVAVVFYACSVAAVGLSMVAIWLYAWRRDLLDPRVDRDLFWYVLLQSLPIPVVFLLSIPVALGAGANAGEFTWIAAAPLLLALHYASRFRITRSKDPS